MATYVIAASVFVLSASFLVSFVVEPPGGSTSDLEHADLKHTAAGALNVMLGGAGYPPTWGASNAGIDAVQRLGLVEAGATIRLDAAKFNALARGKYAMSSVSNAAVDYAEAKTALGLDGYEFHLRAYPVTPLTTGSDHGLSGFDDFRVAYVGKYTGGAFSSDAQAEAASLDALAVTFTNAQRPGNVAGDLFKDDSTKLREHLLPSLGQGVQQEVLGAGSGTKYDFLRVPASAYSSYVPLNNTAPGIGVTTRALALSSDGTALGYTKNRELRAILGAADLTGVTHTDARLNWWEWVDTDGGTGSYDCGDYGLAEVSADNGATWVKLNDNPTDRSQECLTAVSGSMALRTISLAACAACAGNANVLVAFRWVADNDNVVGKGWIVDDVRLTSALVGGVVKLVKTFESPEYDLLVIGSDAAQNAFTPNDIKDGIRDYVDVHGGRILVLGTDGNVQWLDRLLDAGVPGGSGGLVSPDTGHPFLTTPNRLSYESYAAGTPWDLSTNSDAELFSMITGVDTTNHYLTVSRAGAWGSASSEEGSVVLSSYRPAQFSADEMKRFFANAIVYGRYHSLYLEVGPPIPQTDALASVARSATMNKMRDGTTNYTEMAFILYVWPGASAATTYITSAVTPSAPLDLATGVGDGQVWVNWTKPAANGTNDGLRYHVYRGTAQGNGVPYRTVDYDGFNGTFHDYNSTTNGVTQWYNVTLETAAGHGASTTWVSAKPLSLPGTPASPAGVGGLNSIVVSWTAPTTTGPSTIYGYRVDVNDSSGGYVQLTEVGNATSYTHTVYDDLPRSYRVAALNSLGWGATSAASATATAIPIPSAPLAFNMSTATPAAASLSWLPPAQTGGTLTGYIVNRSLDGSAWSTLATLVDPANVSFTDANVAVNSTYWYMVRATSTAGQGANSSAQSGLIGGLPSAPLSFAASGAVVNQTTLTWLAPSDSGTGITGYTLSRSTDHVTWYTLAQIPSGNLTFLDKNVSVNTTYHYMLRANSTGGTGTPTGVQSAPTAGVPYPPTNLQGNRVIATVTLTWSAPTNTGNSAITGYDVYRNGALLTSLLVPSVTYADVGAPGGATYKVRAVNAVGAGNFGATIVVT